MSNGVEHRFQKTTDGGNLARGKLVYQAVDLLLVPDDVRWHGISSVTLYMRI